MLTDPIGDFTAAMRGDGLGEPDTLHADGCIHRFRGEGDKPGHRNAWYLLHLDARPAGAYGSWRTGLYATWCGDHVALTPAEQAAMRRQIEQARATREAEQAVRHAAVAMVAAGRLERAPVADPLHQYLVAKEVKPHGTKQDGDRLLVPVLVAGEVASIQTIAPDGTKRFLPGGRVAGGWYRIDGEPHRPMVICEGFATAATLAEETGATVYAAFHAGNLLSVARHVRSLHPVADVIVAADNDQWTDGNPGVTDASEAALAIGARLLVPDFDGLDLSSRPTDFNDLYRLRRALGVTHG